MTPLHRINRAFCMVMMALLCSLQLHAIEPPVRIMPLGDSLTYGEALTSTQGGYRNDLYDLLTNAGFNVDFIGTLSDTNNSGLPDVDHQGLPGARIDQIQANIGGWLASVEDPDVVLLLIGTNDIWQNYNLATAPGRLENLIADIATKRPFAKIVVSNLPPRIDSSSFEAQQVTYNSAIPGIVAQQVALGRQVTLLDMHSVLTSSSDFSSDGVHPSAQGYGKMADAWAPAISAVISPEGTSNPPLIARIEPITDSTQVSVVFSKPVADGSANLTNFSFSGGLTFSNAVLDPATKRTVTITTAPMTPGQLYTLTVNGVTDRTAQQTPIAPDSKANFSPPAITNGGFEDDYAGWTATGNQEIKTSPQYDPSEGSKLVAFNTGQSSPDATLSQTFATTVGQSYGLTFDMGVFSFNTLQQRLALSVEGSGTLVSDALTIDGIGGGNTKWVPESYVFVANSPTTTVTFTDISTTSDSIDLLIDRVEVTASVRSALAITSFPQSGAAIGISPADANGEDDGATGLIRAYANGAIVTLTAPSSLAGGNFLHWRKNGVDLPGSSESIDVTMNGNQSMCAVYEAATAPTAVNDAYSTDEDSTLVVAASGVLGNDINNSPYPLSAVLDTNPSYGNLTLNSDGSFTYIPAADFHGSDSFTYHANDTNMDSGIALVSITVNPVNDAPVATAQNVSTDEDTALPITLAATDVDGDPINIFNITVAPQHGALTGTAPDLTYTPDPDYHGPDSFSFTVNDGTVDSAAALVSITVNPVNDAPVATAQNVSTDEDTALPITLAGTDVDGDPINIFNVTVAPQHGALTGTAPDLTYTPDPDYHGPDSFSFTVNDGMVDSAAALVSITVNPVNDAPVATAQNVSTDEDTALPITLAGTDVDGDPINIFNITVAPQHGALTGTAPDLTYTPDPNYHGPDSFSFTVNDGTVDSAAALVSITVNPVNDAPVATAQNVSTDEDTALPITLAGTDVDGDPINIFNITVAPQHGALTGTAPDLTYTPDPNYHGPDSFSFTVNDGMVDSAAALVSITVNPVNDAPVATAQNVSTDEDTALPITLAGTDVDGDPINIFNITVAPQHGALTGTAPDLTYTPDPNYHGPDSFSFTVNDGTVDSAAALVSITVNPVPEFTQWLASFGLSASPGEDSDDDTLANALEFVLGGDPASSSDLKLLPSASLVTPTPITCSSPTAGPMSRTRTPTPPFPLNGAPIPQALGWPRVALPEWKF
jgi:VCBS repeat-containing protein